MEGTVIVSGNLRKFCEMQKGTRQRCPLFSFLIIVVLEILIRQYNRNMKVKIKRKASKLRAFGDDLLVLEEPLKGTETLIEKVKQFGTQQILDNN